MVRLAARAHRIDQHIRECGAGMSATVDRRRRDPAPQLPGHPRPVRHRAAGSSSARSTWPANAARIADEARALLTAPACPALDATDLILGGEQMALQIHESVGHAIELDRILGWEAAFAGTSWLDLAQLGSLRFGSRADERSRPTRRSPARSGSFGYDDEGTPAHPVDIVRDGIWVGRAVRPRLGGHRRARRPAAAVRADGFNRLPMVRMTNVGLLPGTHTLDEMIAATDDGILMDTNRSWSIDDKRLNFQFGCEIGWEIKGGKRGRMLRNPTYTGIGPRFWGSMDMLGDRDEWTFWGTPNCGKGQPQQIGHTGHPAAPARFRGDPRGGARVSARERSGRPARWPVAAQVLERVRAPVRPAPRPRSSVETGDRRADPLRQLASSTRTSPRSVSHVVAPRRGRRPGAATSLDGVDGPTTGPRAARRPARSPPRPVAPGRPGLAGPGAAPPPCPPVDHWDDGDRGRDARRAGARSSARSSRRPAASRRRAPARPRRSLAAFANTAGQRLTGRSTVATHRRHRPDADAPTAAARRDVGAARRPRRRRRRRAGRAARRATARRTRATSNPAATRSSSSRRAVADILEFLCDLRLQRPGRRGGPVVRAARRARSSTRRSRSRDDATDPGTVGLAFDAEGTPSGAGRRRRATA